MIDTMSEDDGGDVGGMRMVNKRVVSEKMGNKRVVRDDNCWKTVKSEFTDDEESEEEVVVGEVEEEEDGSLVIEEEARRVSLLMSEEKKERSEEDVDDKLWSVASNKTEEEEDVVVDDESNGRHVDSDLLNNNNNNNKKKKNNDDEKNDERWVSTLNKINELIVDNDAEKRHVVGEDDKRVLLQNGKDNNDSIINNNNNDNNKDDEIIVNGKLSNNNMSYDKSYNWSIDTDDTSIDSIKCDINNNKMLPEVSRVRSTSEKVERQEFSSIDRSELLKRSFSIPSRSFIENTPSPAPKTKRRSMNSNNRTEVGVKIKIKLDYIDDVNQEIHTEVFLSMHYKCTSAREFVSGQLGFVAISPDEHPDMLVPKIEFLNFRSCDHIEGFRLLVNTKSGVVYIYRVYRIVFRSLLKLNRFPFDRQIVNIELKSYTATLLPWSMPEEDIPYGIRADSLWKDHDIVVECDGSLWSLNWTRGTVHRNNNPSVYIASFGIERISLFYIMNFFMVTFFIVLSTFGCLAIHYKDFASRSSITFTILLTVISMKYIMSSYTPKINYPTWLDYYNLLGMAFVLCIILENYVVANATSFSLSMMIGLHWELLNYPIDVEVIDVYVPNFLMWIWIILHVLLFVGWFFDSFFESWEEVYQKETDSDLSRIHGDVVDE